MSRLPVLNIRKPKRFTQKSSEAIVDLFKSQTSRQFNNIGIHLTFNRCMIKSSVAKFNPLLRILLMKNLHIVYVLTCYYVVSTYNTKNTPKNEFHAPTAWIRPPVEVDVHAHSLL